MRNLGRAGPLTSTCLLITSSHNARERLNFRRFAMRCSLTFSFTRLDITSTSREPNSFASAKMWPMIGRDLLANCICVAGAGILLHSSNSWGLSARSICAYHHAYNKSLDASGGSVKPTLWAGVLFDGGIDYNISAK